MNKGRTVSEYLLPPAPKEALAYRFAQARAPVYWTNLQRPPVAVRAFFESNRNLQTYGGTAPGRSLNYKTYAPLHESFDALWRQVEDQGPA